MSTELLQSLRALHFNGMAMAVEDWLDQRPPPQDPEVWLAKLIAAESQERANRSLRYQMRTARFPAQRSLDDFDFGESPADKNALLRLPDGHYLGAAHSRSDPVQISALTPVQICTLIDSPHCAFHQCRLSSRAETHKYTENTMTTTTKAAFVADLAETHNMNPQNAQEAVNAVVATLTQALIDGHGINCPDCAPSPSRSGRSYRTQSGYWGKPGDHVETHRPV